MDIVQNKALLLRVRDGNRITSVIPKSKTESRIVHNLEGDFELPAEDVERIASIDKKLRFNDPSKNFGWDFYKDLDGKRN